MVCNLAKPAWPPKAFSAIFRLSIYESHVTVCIYGLFAIRTEIQKLALNLYVLVLSGIILNTRAETTRVYKLDSIFFRRLYHCLVNDDVVEGD